MHTTQSGAPGGAVQIAEYQQWFTDYDRRRGLDLVEPSQVVVHLMEEIGEIAREVLYLEGYRDPNDREDAVGRLSEELGDALVFLTKIAIHYGIDLETVASNIMAKAETRWPVEQIRQEMARYIKHQQATCRERVTAWQERAESAHG